MLPAILLLAAGLAQAGSLRLVNGGFEDYATGGSQTQDPAHGWLTTATDSQIEIWSAAVPYWPWGPGNGEYVPAYAGDKFAELNANQVAALYQDVDFTGIPAGTLLTFGFAHRGRMGSDTMRLRIVDLGPDGQLGGGDDAVLFSKEYTTDNAGWVHYTDTTTLAAANRKVRFYYEAVSTAGDDASVGNFLDACEFGIGGPFSTAGWWNGTASGSWNSGPDLNWSKNVSTLALDSGTFDEAMTLSGGVAYFADSYFASGTEVPVTRSAVNIAAGGVSAASVVFLGDAVNYALGGADANGITGATALKKSGLSTLALTGTNTFSGPTTITAGAIKLANAQALKNSTVTVSANNGLTFQSGIGTFLLGGLAGGENLALVDSTSEAVALHVGANNAGTTYSGVLSGSGGMTKVGDGTLLLTANSTFTGGTVVDAGTLTLNRGNSGNNNSQLRGSLTVNMGATLNMAAASGNPFGWGGGLTNLFLNGGTAIGTGYGAFGIVYGLKGGTLNSPGRLDLGTWDGTDGAIHSLASSTESVVSSDGIMLRGDSGQTSYTISAERGSTVSGVDLEIDAAIGENWGPISVVKEGPGTLLLTANNGYSGGTVVNGGTLALNGENSGGNSQLRGTLTINAGATLSLANHPLGWGGGLTAINLNGGTATGSTYGAFGIVYNLTGGRFDSPGQLHLGTQNGIDGAIRSHSSPTTSVIDAADGIWLRGDSGQTSYTIDTQTGASSGVDLQINAGMTQVWTAGLVKDGLGTLVLAGDSSYTGPTTVHKGTLRVDGSLHQDSAVTVESEGTLGGRGTVHGTVDVHGKLEVGDGVGTLNTGSETWSAGGSYTWEINDATGAAGGPSGWTHLAINGTLNLTATALSRYTIQVVSLAGATPGEASHFDSQNEYHWPIATASGGVTGFDVSKFVLDTSRFQNFTGGGTFFVELVGNSLQLGFTPHSCASGDFATPSWAVVEGTIRITLANPYGLSEVMGLRFVNISLTGTAYAAGDVSLGGLGSVLDDGSKVTLPVGTVKVVMVGSKVGAGRASCNARAFDMCGFNSTTIDPVNTQITVTGLDPIVETFPGIPSAEHFVSVQNGRPGLTQLKVLVNGRAFVLAGLQSGGVATLDVGSAMIPGENNTVVLVGEGPVGASATVAIGDAMPGDPLDTEERPRMRIVYSGGSLQLSWPGNASGYVLQGRYATDSADGWVNCPAAPQLVSGQFRVLTPTEGPARLFRLFKR